MKKQIPSILTPLMLALALGSCVFSSHAWSKPNSNPNSNEGDQDPDHDGLTNVYEAQYRTDPKKADTDGDGWSDYDEVVYTSSPIKRKQTPDDDNDGLYLCYELQYRTNPNKADTDGDGASDYNEIISGTDPLMGNRSKKKQSKVQNNRTK